jgi:hypothetical protein
MNPEARAREKIDEKLEAAGWVVQDRLAMDLGAGPGVVVREFTLDTGEADHVLFGWISGTRWISEAVLDCLPLIVCLSRQ